MMTSSSSLPVPSGVPKAAAAGTGVWSKLRIPVLIASILFLLASLAASVVVPHYQRDGTLPSPLTDLFVRAAPPPTLQDELAYAERLRADARRLAEQGDDENALVRLDQAAEHDAPGDRTNEIQHLRQELRARVGEVMDLEQPAHGAIR